MACRDLAGGINSPEREKTVISASLVLFVFLDKSSKRVQNQRYAERWGNPIRSRCFHGTAPQPKSLWALLVEYGLQASPCCRADVCVACWGKRRGEIHCICRVIYLDLTLKLSSHFKFLVFYSIGLSFSTFFWSVNLSTFSTEDTDLCIVS